MRNKGDKIENILHRVSQYMANRNLEEALQLLERTDEDEYDFRLKNNLAWFYYKIGIKSVTNNRWYYQPDLAKTFFEEAVLFGDSHYPFSNLGELYIKLKAYNFALNILEKAVLFEKTVSNQNNLAVAQIHLKQYEEASQILASLCETKNIDAEKYIVVYNYGIALYFSGNNAELKKVALYLYKQYCEDNIEIDVLDAMDISLILHLAGNYVHADEVFPHEGYVMLGNNFKEHLLTLKKLGKNDEMKQFHDKVINDIQEEIDDMGVQNNQVIINSKKYKLMELDLIYQNIGNYSMDDLSISPISIVSNYLY